MDEFTAPIERARAGGHVELTIHCTRNVQAQRLQCTPIVRNNHRRVCGNRTGIFFYIKDFFFLIVLVLFAGLSFLKLLKRTADTSMEGSHLRDSNFCRLSLFLYQKEVISLLIHSVGI